MHTIPIANQRATRILIVEDNDVNCRLLSDYLKYCGYSVSTVANGLDFFPNLAQFNPDLILLDLKLPGVDGYTLLYQLQCSSRWRQVPVVVLSAFAFKADRQRAMALGARNYLIKPVGLGDVNQAIAQELNLVHG